MQATKNNLILSTILAYILQHFGSAGIARYIVSTRKTYTFKSTACADIADTFETLPHAPEHTLTSRAYSALVRETLAQFEALRVAGFRFEAFTADGMPYASAAEVIADVQDNQHLFVYLGGEMPADHPLARKVGIFTGSYEWTANDVFRAVHDVLGHAAHGFDFSPVGEWNATHAHSLTYSFDALPALLAETVFQASWRYFGKHRRDEAGNTPEPTEAEIMQDCGGIPFAEQKALALTPAHVEMWRRAYATN